MCEGGAARAAPPLFRRHTVEISGQHPGHAGRLGGERNSLPSRESRIRVHVGRWVSFVQPKTGVAEVWSDRLVNTLYEGCYRVADFRRPVDIELQ